MYGLVHAFSKTHEYLKDLYIWMEMSQILSNINDDLFYN